MVDSSTQLTASAQACLDAARQDAATRQSLQVEPEHLLMAILQPSAGAAWNMLVGLLGDPLPVRKRAEEALAQLPIYDQMHQPSLSFRIERVLAGAGDVARLAGTPIDSQHLLVGLLEEGGPAAHILRQVGIDAKTVRAWVRQRKTVAPQPAPAVTPAPAPVRASLRPKPRPAVTGPLRRVLFRLIDWRAVITLIGIMGIGAWLTTQPDYQTAGVVFFVFGGWVFSLCMHEFGHALTADIGGDQSVREKGYLSFNPLAYAHPLLSIIMPILFVLIGGFGLPGGAVYVDRTRLRGPKWDSLVSAAGPLASLVATLIFAAPFALGLVRPSMVYAAPELWGAFALVVMLNVSAVLFNCLPVPPLDGFGIIAPWLSPELRARLYAVGFLGLWLVILVFWQIESVNRQYWDTVFNVMQMFGVGPDLASYGLYRFWFWR